MRPSSLIVITAYLREEASEHSCFEVISQWNVNYSCTNLQTQKNVVLPQRWSRDRKDC